MKDKKKEEKEEETWIIHDEKAYNVTTLNRHILTFPTK